MIDLSVVVLCYHSGESILPIYSQLNDLLEEMSIEYEIVLVANDFAKSKDKTNIIVKNLAAENSKVKPVSIIKQGMMGWDMLQGFNASIGEIICVIDGDGQFPISSIEKGYNIIKNGEFDIVKTYRNNREDGIYRIILSSVYNFVFRILYPGLNSKDVNSKPKLIRRSAYQKLDLNSTDWFIDAEIMIRARYLNLTFFEFPIRFGANKSRKSFVKFNGIFEFIVNLIRFKFK